MRGAEGHGARHGTLASSAPPCQPVKSCKKFSVAFMQVCWTHNNIIQIVIGLCKRQQAGGAGAAGVSAQHRPRKKSHEERND